MILNATLSSEEAAWLLGSSTADTDARVRTGELACTTLGAARIGWRSLVAALGQDFAHDPELRRKKLFALQTLRAGGDPTVEAAPADTSVDESGTRSGHSNSSAVSEIGERPALLREAARSVGGGEHLSCKAFDQWAARNELALTASAFVGQYGSWNASKRAAGIAVREPRHQRTATNDELLGCLRAAADERGDKRVTMVEFDAFCVSSGIDADALLVASRFGSWNRAKVAVSLTPRGRGHQRDMGPTDPYRDPNQPAES
jgi:hypothetical protein